MNSLHHIFPLSTCMLLGLISILWFISHLFLYILVLFLHLSFSSPFSPFYSYSSNLALTWFPLTRVSFSWNCSFLLIIWSHFFLFILLSSSSLQLGFSSFSNPCKTFYVCAFLQITDKTLRKIFSLLSTFFLIPPDSDWIEWYNSRD